MPSKAKEPTNSASLPTKQSALFVLGTTLDTTWRMFVPSVGGAVLGVWGDRSLHLKPWLTIAGITFGTVVAVLLVRLQLKHWGGRA